MRHAGGRAGHARNLGSLVFGDHSLNLEQKIVLRGATNRVVQEDNLRTRAAKLIDQEHLMGITASEPIRGMDINAIDLAASNSISQPLQRRRNKIVPL